jgi:hypothetical protein
MRRKRVRLVRARDTDLDLVYEAGKRKEAGGRLKYYGVGVRFQGGSNRCI